MKPTPVERRNSPAIIVRLELERSPIVYVDGEHQGDLRRLYDWLEHGRPELGRLLGPLLELADRKAA